MKDVMGLTNKRPNKFKRERDCVFRDLITALAVCHNVTPVDDDGTRTFQASSPDEIALVKIAESVGLRLERRDQLRILLSDSAGHSQTYEVLHNFPFSSDTKRMGIVVRHVEEDMYIFYLKGADVIMK
jgi:phospholipid-translocating ATPase